jgi:RimJ/RimL family protein N-acetyltransferase
MIQTTRLLLIPATAAHVRAEIHDRQAFGTLLNASVPDNWPPENVADALPLFLSWLEAAPDAVGWFGWYAVTRAPDAPRAVVGGGGFLGPAEQGQVMLGYSVLPQFQGQGFASEIADGLVRWAFTAASVQRIVAETEWANPASVRVLEKLGFTTLGAAANDAGHESGGTRFALHRE